MAEVALDETDSYVPAADAAVPRSRCDPSPAIHPTEEPAKLPGCRPIHLSPSALMSYEKRLEYWERSTETAWVAEPTTVAHEAPTRRLGQLAALIAAVRGSPIAVHGAMDLVLPDEHGEPQRLMQADETLYLHPDRARLPVVRLNIGEHDYPDVVLEVDYSTDVRQGKLGIYQRWGFPEIWVEVPANPSYRPRRRQGLAVHVRDTDGYREVAESRAFPGWTAEEIHEALRRGALSDGSYRVLERVGRRLGALEGTGPDDDPWLRSLRGETRAEERAGLLRSLFQVRGIEVSEGLTREVASRSGVSREALMSAAMSCEDEADFRARVRDM